MFGFMQVVYQITSCLLIFNTCVHIVVPVRYILPLIGIVIYNKRWYYMHMNSVAWSDRARDFASECHINLDADPLSAAYPVLMPLDDHGQPLLHITGQDEEVDFYVSRIDYYNDTDEITGSRLISLILPGYRSHSAFVNTGARQKVFQVHQGTGHLIVGTPPLDEEDADLLSTEFFSLDPTVTPTVTIPVGHFFTFEAAAWSDEPLIVSEKVMPSNMLPSQSTKILDGRQTSLVAADGAIVPVPEEFQTGNFH